MGNNTDLYGVPELEAAIRHRHKMVSRLVDAVSPKILMMTSTAAANSNEAGSEGPMLLSDPELYLGTADPYAHPESFNYHDNCSRFIEGIGFVPV